MDSVLTPKWVTISLSLLLALGLFFEYTNEMVAMIISLIFAMWLAIVLHEIGHIVFGIRNGFELIFFTFGPFLFERTSEGSLLLSNSDSEVVGGLTYLTKLLGLQFTDCSFDSNQQLERNPFKVRSVNVLISKTKL